LKQAIDECDDEDRAIVGDVVGVRVGIVRLDDDASTGVVQDAATDEGDLEHRC